MPAHGPSRRAPLDAASLEAAALAYVERFQTTRARLARLLAAKLSERGWAGSQPPDVAAVVERLAALGYVDDAAWAEARARGLERRGMGRGRVEAVLRANGVEEDARAAATAGLDAVAAALALARRRRLGPFGAGAPDAAGRQRQLAVLLRAGHPPALARAIVDAASLEALDGLDALQG